MYCGWEPGRDDALHGAVVREASYVEGATLVRFALATLLLAPLGVALLRGAVTEGAPLVFALGLLALVPGPIVLAVQLVRRLRGGVATERLGLRLPDGRLLLWNELDRVEHVAGIDGERESVSQLARFFEGGPGAWRAAGTATGARGLTGFLFLPLVLVATLVTPAVALLTPWHDRVVLSGRGVTRLVLHDLADVQEFLITARARIEGPAARRAAA